MTGEDHSVTISEKTRIHLTLSQAAFLAALIGSWAVSVYALKSAHDQHVANTYVHLDPKFTTEHGVVLGKWDMSGPIDTFTAAVKALNEQADISKRRQDAFESELDRRRPKWHQ